ncbi:MAG: hypothetical protein NTZ37_01620 [Methanoregula sp.]|nr:hypothetical protein [Methanoregula sp.]
MADNGVCVESGEAALLSEIGKSSARMMKVAYLPYPEKNRDEDYGVPHSQPVKALVDDEASGPNAMIYVTKISTRTPHEEIKNLLKTDSGREAILRNSDFYTILLSTSIRMGDPSTTRFINATIEFVCTPGTKILDYSPKERGIITEIIERCVTGISLSQTLDFVTSSSQRTKIQPDTTEDQFELVVGPETKITGTYNKKSGYSLEIPHGELLEYQIMLKNEHEMYGEIYPPMPAQDIETTGRENLAVFSLIIQTPRNTIPEIHVHFEGRVKGNLWGVIPLKGSVVFTKTCNGS